VRIKKLNVDIVLYDKRAYIKLHRKNANALNLSFLKELSNCIDEVETLKEIRLVIIQSAIKGICSSGLDLGELFIKDDRKKTRQNIMTAVKMVFEINQKILGSKHIYYFIANGALIGSAVSIMLACDIRGATNNSWIWLPDVRYGGLLGDGGIDLLVQRSSIADANSIGLLNSRYNAAQLRNNGVFDWVCKTDEVELYIQKELIRIEEFSLLSMSLTKKIINQQIRITYQEELLHQIFDSEDVYIQMSKYIKN
jgi:enoyl-CoA hydratase